MRRLQQKWCSIAVSSALVAMVGAAQAATVETAAVAKSSSPAVKAFESTGRMPYIVGFRDAPAVTYEAQLNQAPTPPLLGKAGLDTDASVEAYAAQLEGRQRASEARLKSAVGRNFHVQHRMQHAFNGIVAELTPAEAAAFANDPTVTLVEPYTEYALDDEVAPSVIGANTVWEDGTGFHRAAFISRGRTEVSVYNRRAKGEGVIVGIVDSGINFASPSFAGTEPATGHEFKNPLGEGNYLGTCATGGVDAGRCNDKLIGGYDFVCGPPANLCGAANIAEEPGFGDTNSHGTHTAGTTAGNTRTTTFRGNTVTLTGIAPRANVIAYDACYTNTATGQGLCPNVSTLASINQAIADGVDVINYSIGGGSQPWSEAISQAFLAATDAGIFVSASAGNSGPNPSTNGHSQPWVMTVAAAQSGRAGYEFTLNTSGAGVPTNLSQVLLAAGTGGVELTTSIPSSVLRAGPGFTGAADGCTASGAFPAGFFSNRIALVRRGTCAFTEKAANAAAAGARAVIIVNNTTGGISPSVPGATVPVFGMAQDSGVALQALTVSNPALAASVPFPATRIDNAADQLAAFSSRGPAAFSVLKPDITGHGVNILEPVACANAAQWTTAACVQTIGFLSGTSMSSPQVAGSGALLRQLFPTWTPAEIKSALMMTARQGVLNETGAVATPFQAGAGRVQVDAAAKAGLVLDEQRADYTAANPALGGDVSQLNLASLTNRGCSATTCTFTRTFRSTRGTFQTFSLSLSGVTGTISTPVFTIAPFGTQTVTVTVNTAGQPADGTYRFGTLTLASTGNDASTRSPTLRLPIAVAVRNPELGLSTETIAISAPANTTRSANFTLWSNSNPVDFTTSTTGTGTGAVVSQSSAGATSGYATGRYSDLGIGQFAADDFVLTQATTLASISNEGFVLGTGTIPATTVIGWSIFADAGGVPAGNPETSPNAAVWRYSAPANSAGISTAGGVLRLNLAAAGQNVTLQPGRYWLVPQVNAVFANRFAWFFSQQGNGTAPRTIIPSNAAPNNVWTTPAGAPTGLAYTLNGTVGCGAPWISGLAPASGRAVAGAPSTVSFNVNTAGLAPGNYSGFVCLGSNDPNRATATVRVNLTVTP
ncbi:S8 family serine peptidase [Silanimonas sp.]|jgi:subtilisin family serine protease|uniref:S8 family serine peptidase n=1 Tax=Silanimonas sp. TaxID=1929290 RepID=UPI0022C1D456|nr:S8 family serine peptidase [Silanimonas sp.]MCZ8114696.1 S8 family serine peptidase [Silanimonas sp.]